MGSDRGWEGGHSHTYINYITPKGEGGQTFCGRDLLCDSLIDLQFYPVGSLLYVELNVIDPPPSTEILFINSHNY